MSTLSELIRNCKAGAAGNPYQGKDKKVLFVCSMGILRSATAARLYAKKYNTRCAGTYPDALIPISPILIAWADEIVCVNTVNYTQLVREYPGIDEVKQVKVLNIPDSHEHMAPELVKAFKEQYEDF